MATSDHFVEYKETGIEKYKEAKQVGLTPNAAREAYQSAIGWFKRALAEAKDGDQKAQAEKNLATTSLELANLLLDIDGNPQEVFSQYKLSLLHYDRALQSGREHRYPKWIEHLETAYRTCLKTALDFIQHDQVFTMGEQTRLIQSIMSNTKEEPIRASCNLMLARMYFDEGMKHLRSYSEIIDSFNECQQFLREILSGDGNVIQEATELNRRSKEELRKVEAKKLLADGKEQFEEMDQDGDLNVDMMYAVIDCLRKAIAMSREQAVDLEAEANSYLGRLYDTVLNHKVKATEHYNISLFLADSIGEDTLKQTEWYQKAQQGLERYKDTAALRETGHSSQDQSGLDKDIGQLRQARQEYDDIDFIHFITETFPARVRKKPIAKKCDMKAMSKKEMCKNVIKMVPMYHPDKQKGQEGDWIALCDDITKELNQIIDNNK